MRRPLPLALVSLGVALSSVLVPVAASSAPAVSAARPAASRQADYVPPALVWNRCADASLRQAKARCAMLTVPLDYADPTGPTIQVAVARVQHTSKTYRGVMLTNPGGPGGEGRWVATLGQYVPGKVAASYDWIGVDPRGVGASRPALSCDGKYFSYDRPPYEPKLDLVRKAWMERAEGYAADCGTSAAASLLPHLKSIDTIADFESLRVALGVDKVSYYGFSYGTYLGQLYASLHPDRIDKMVLDGVIDANQSWYVGNLKQDPAFEKVIKKFFAWMARAPRDYRMGRTGAEVYDSYRALLRKLSRKPQQGVGPAELADAILGAGYNVYSWPDTAAALSAAAHGRIRPIKEAYRADNPVGKGADNGYAMYLATQCTDNPWPADWATWAKDNKAMNERAPYLTWANAWFNMPCRTWPAPAAQEVAIDGSVFTGKLLLISETFDAATPFKGALAARKLFPTASLIEGVKGTTHAASLYGVACVDNRIARYLETGKAPKRKRGNRSDVKCPGLTPPAPGLSRTAPRRPAIGIRG